MSTTQTKHSMTFELRSPEGGIEIQNVSMVELPGELGRFCVLPMHAPLISSLKEGVLTYQSEKEKKSFNIGVGIMKVEENRVTVLVEKYKEEMISA